MKGIPEGEQLWLRLMCIVWACWMIKCSVLRTVTPKSKIWSLNSTFVIMCLVLSENRLLYSRAFAKRILSDTTRKKDLYGKIRKRKSTENLNFNFQIVVCISILKYSKTCWNGITRPRKKKKFFLDIFRFSEKNTAQTYLLIPWNTVKPVKHLYRNKNSL